MKEKVTNLPAGRQESMNEMNIFSMVFMRELCLVMSGIIDFTRFNEPLRGFKDGMIAPRITIGNDVVTWSQ